MPVFLWLFSYLLLRIICLKCEEGHNLRSMRDNLYGQRNTITQVNTVYSFQPQNKVMLVSQVTQCMEAGEGLRSVWLTDNRR